APHLRSLGSGVRTLRLSERSEQHFRPGRLSPSTRAPLNQIIEIRRPEFRAAFCISADSILRMSQPILSCKDGLREAMCRHRTPRAKTLRLAELRLRPAGLAGSADSLLDMRFQKLRITRDP